MSKSKTLFAIGIWVGILPYLGFPFALKNLLFSITGLLIIYIWWNVYKIGKQNKEQNFENFSENVFSETNE